MKHSGKSVPFKFKGVHHVHKQILILRASRKPYQCHFHHAPRRRSQHRAHIHSPLFMAQSLYCPCWQSPSFPPHGLGPHSPASAGFFSCYTPRRFAFAAGTRADRAHGTRRTPSGRSPLALRGYSDSLSIRRISRHWAGRLSAAAQWTLMRTAQHLLPHNRRDNVSLARQKQRDFEVRALAGRRLQRKQKPRA